MKTLAMILAGGRGKRLSILTQKRAKPAVPFAGKYRIIDFPLSNCANSGITTVGVVTQYRPRSLNDHIRIGAPWDPAFILTGLSGLSRGPSLNREIEAASLNRGGRERQAAPCLLHLILYVIDVYPSSTYIESCPGIIQSLKRRSSPLTLNI